MTLKSRQHSDHIEWLFARVSGLILAFLIPWLFLSLPSVRDLTAAGLTLWLHRPLSLILVVLVLFACALHSALGVRTILDDYLSSACLRKGSLLFIFAVLLIAAIGGLIAAIRLALAPTP